MTTSGEQFEKFRQSVYGRGRNKGIFLLDDCPDGPIRNYYEGLQKRCSSVAKNFAQGGPKPQDLNFDSGYAFRDDWGAQAVLEDSWRFIVLGHKAPIVIDRIANIILSRNDTLATVGDVDSEEQSRGNQFLCESRPPGISTSDWIRSQFVQRPRDETRKKVAEYVVVTLADFLTLHECAHHLLGHLHLKDAANWPPHWKDGPDILDLQSMELDADSFAVNQVIRNFLVPELMKIKGRSSNEAFWGSVDVAAEAAIIFLGAYMWLDRPFSRAVSDFYKYSHPHSAVRWYVVQNTCENWIKRNCPELKERLLTSLNRGLAELIGLMKSERLGLDLNWDPIKFEDDLKECTKDMEYRANRLRPSLARFAIGAMPVVGPVGPPRRQLW